MRSTSTRRRSVVFSEPQAVYLEKESERLGISVGELVRRIIDESRPGFNEKQRSVRLRKPSGARAEA